ncbi:hypothetical protein ACFFX0_15525 [Citricoccus parietis]|uniref:Uncharacterized protein n=1 Tax=Citricoccus parietis TaxID=592307 RepID=A0ABV5G1K5_9MICC
MRIGQDRVQLRGRGVDQDPVADLQRTRVHRLGPAGLRCGGGQPGLRVDGGFGVWPARVRLRGVLRRVAHVPSVGTPEVRDPCLLPVVASASFSLAVESRRERPTRSAQIPNPKRNARDGRRPVLVAAWTSDSCSERIGMVSVTNHPFTTCCWGAPAVLPSLTALADSADEMFDDQS